VDGRADLDLLLPAAAGPPRGAGSQREVRPTIRYIVRVPARFRPSVGVSGDSPEAAQRPPGFVPTAAVRSARRRGQYIPCPACGSRLQRYQFHRTGVRFVRCRACDLVYADPVDPKDRAYFDIHALGQHESAIDRHHAQADFLDIAERLITQYQHRFHRRPRHLLVAGRWHNDFLAASSLQLDVDLASRLVDDETRLVSTPLVETLGAKLADSDIVLLNEFLDAVIDPLHVLRGLVSHLRTESLVAVTVANMSALPSRALRRRWKGFFDKKVAFYNADNLEALMWRLGFQRIAGERLTTTYSLGYLASRLELSPSLQRCLGLSHLAHLSGRLASGHELVLFQRASAPTADSLSIIVPVYNEAPYVGGVLTGLIEKELPIDREIIVVESGSSDGSREIVRSFEARYGLRVIYQDAPRGKGNAVREGLARATGTIVLIQDADFEYDLDDYDALLEPIIQRRASFVLGSRSLGLDDWKVRDYGTSPFKGVLMNLAQVAFARTFNLLYQQKVTDINTMLKVFRRECIAGCHLDCDGFDFDIELVCKIVRNGFEPMEIPINYVARGFDDGKKVRFLIDAYPSYYQLFRCRLGRP